MRDSLIWRFAWQVLLRVVGVVLVMLSGAIASHYPLLSWQSAGGLAVGVVGLLVLEAAYRRLYELHGSNERKEV